MTHRQTATRDEKLRRTILTITLPDRRLTVVLWPRPPQASTQIPQDERTAQ